MISYLVRPAKVLKCFNISASEFGSMGMYRRMQACSDEFLATVTEGVVHGVYKVVIQSSSRVIRQHKVNGGTWTRLSTVTLGRIRISNSS